MDEREGGGRAGSNHGRRERPLQVEIHSIFFSRLGDPLAFHLIPLTTIVVLHRSLVSYC